MDILGKALDKAFWETVRDSEDYARFVETHKSIYEMRSEKPLEALRYSDFKKFYTVGTRGEYESPYFARRHLMAAAAILALVYPENGEYLDTLMDTVYAICDEYTWCVPAHQGQLEPNNNCRIDLFASETGFALAEIYKVLEDRLEPLIKNRIAAELDRRIVKPFTSVENYGWWENGKSNWTAVCMTSVAGVIMHMKPHLMTEELIARINRAMDSYLSGFESDGICTEGCAYWDYGFGLFTVYADMIYRFTDGRINYFENAKVRSVATFMQKMYLSGKTVVSFSDCGKISHYHAGLVHRLKKEYPEDVALFNPEYAIIRSNCTRFCLEVRAYTWFEPEYFKAYEPSEVNEEYYADVSQWFVKKTAAYGFAAKGGHNGEMHNHNDVGTFIFAKDGRQVLCDLGPGAYTRQYFSGERYTVLEAASFGHSVPIIGGKHQKAGAAYSSKNTSVNSGVFVTDIAGAYGDEAVKSIVRSFECTPDSVTLNDKFSVTGAIVERFVTLIEPKVSEGRIELEEVTLTYGKTLGSCTVSTAPSGRSAVYLIDIALNEGVTEFTLNVK